MNWKNDLLSTQRLRPSRVDNQRAVLSENTDNRNPFESDFGRVIFSSASRRLHDKTQVFPLTSDDNIHSRLTHSMEVMNIGLSFAIYLSGNDEFKKKTQLTSEEILRKIDPILKTSCLVHDIGNPPFGHFGEQVIQNYFSELFKDIKCGIENENIGSSLSKYVIKGVRYINYIGKWEKDTGKDINTRRKQKKEYGFKTFLNNKNLIQDYVEFDGNAEGFRILTKLQYLGDLFGLNLTCSTLASTLKYPNYGIPIKTEDENDKISLHKHGVFFTERKTLDDIAKYCKLEQSNGMYKRHPLAFLMEAADSICYLVMDLEDANQKQWLTLNDVKDKIANDPYISDEIKEKLDDNLRTTQGDNISSKKEWVSYRTILLTHLMGVATKNFVQNLEQIEEGTYNKELIEDNDGIAKALKDFSKKKILSKREITSLEITGDAVIVGILNSYIRLLFHTDKNYRDRGKSLFSRSIFMTVLHEHWEEYCADEDFENKYGKDIKIGDLDKLYDKFDVCDFTVEERFRLIRDFVACMTDKFALDHYQKISGQRI
ncbi:dGTP triphosphohydrolase [Bacteroides cellulosilyticus]|uniref:DNTP triphosphohydrolase n=1 Tax=Bacteroides cellulosilyticus TaxID=246787 RepID=A0A5M6A117_9BACE|nr:dNTP triphosphohydrolase [Bacteroides cellulosilyticus]KAA5402064.1 dNTP triphosphohydrolase [Bacteroides cellulosilyticus]RYU10898.1 dNTP triphosphohydrolase [Bacteroides cellulosilyticus]